MNHEERLRLIMKPFPPIEGGFRTVRHPRSYTWAGTIIGDNFQGAVPRTRKADEGGFTVDTYEEAE